MVRVVGLMMGVWFLSTSMAQYVGGLIAQFASVETVGGEVLDPKIALDTYIGVFTQIPTSVSGLASCCSSSRPIEEDDARRSIRRKRTE